MKYKPINSSQKAKKLSGNVEVSYGSLAALHVVYLSSDWILKDDWVERAERLIGSRIDFHDARETLSVKGWADFNYRDDAKVTGLGRKNFERMRDHFILSAPLGLCFGFSVQPIGKDLVIWFEEKNG